MSPNFPGPDVPGHPTRVPLGACTPLLLCLLLQCLDSGGHTFTCAAAWQQAPQVHAGVLSCQWAQCILPIHGFLLPSRALKSSSFPVPLHQPHQELPMHLLLHCHTNIAGQLQRPWRLEGRKQQGKGPVVGQGGP